LRERKLLLNKKEIAKLASDVKERGYSIVPLDIHFVRGKVKVTIALAKGKKNYDKREDMKEKDSSREIARAMKGN
jgi:SsrA-binding protein